MITEGFAPSTWVLPPRGTDLDADILHEEITQRRAAESRLALVRHYREQPEWLDYEFPNVQRSHAWLATQGEQWATRLVIAYVEILAPYLIQRGLNAVFLQWCEAGLAACMQLEQNPARLLLLSSEAQRLLGHWDRAIADIQSALETSKNREPLTYAQAVFALGRLQLNQGQYKQAIDTLAVADTLLVEQSDEESLAAVRAEMAAYYLHRGQ